MKPRRRRSLSGEELRLWSGVARLTTPLPGKTLPSVPEETPPLTPPLAPPPQAALEPPAAEPPARRRPAPLHPIERGVRRKLAKGRLPIEARIDLHEMNQAAAYYALLAFLRRAQGEGLRHVLVITGRGASSGSRGVLRRAVPHWFSTPEFRTLVAGCDAAERRHGGEGALYVRVRRR